MLGDGRVGREEQRDEQRDVVLGEPLYRERPQADYRRLFELDPAIDTAKIAADRAGRRFGQLAVRAPQRLQQAVAGGLADSDLLPDVSDLPEYLRAEQFVQRYGSVGSAGGASGG